MLCDTQSLFALYRSFLAAAVRLLRRVTGMKAANDDVAGRWMRRYTAALFRIVLSLHEVVAPVLGCGQTTPAPSLPPAQQ